MSNRSSYFLAVIILFIAAVLRFIDLNSLPPGFRDAEINEIRLTETIRAGGQIEVFYNISGEGREGLYHITQALLTSILGNGPLGYRLLSVWASMLLLAVVYALSTRLYGRVSGLSTTALLSVMMWAILLSRQVALQAILPGLVAAVLLALAWALPVYRRIRVGTTNTTSFAILGFLLGIGLYIHPISLLIILISMSFITYMLIAKQTFMSRRRLSYIGFTILVMIIIAVPYLISTINRPDLAIAGRDLGTYRGTLQSMSDALASLFFVGDYNPAHNLPQRPLIDLISGFFVLIGLFTTLRFWAQPRFILILIASAILLPTMIITESSPNFLALSSLLPMIALYFGIGVQIVWQSVAARWRWLLGLLLIALYGYNIYWTSNDLFNRWPMLEEVQAVYHAPQGELARYIDRTVDEIPTVICIPNWDQPPEPTSDLSDTRLTLLMMNRQQNQLRRVDCRNGLLLANGGEMTQMILPETVVLESMHDHLKQWLNQAEPISGDDIPEESVYMFKVSDTLADTAGMFLLTSPVSYPPDIESEVGATAVEPPVRFGGNITLLGYELTNREVNDAGELIPPTVMAGDVVPVITYWRIEGEVPRDLTFFTHILSDPVTIAANRDYISADPRLLQERDVLIQVTDVQLAESLLAGDYTVSTGAYQDIDKTRLVVLENEQPRGDRLFLYPITIEAQPEAEEE